jgi:hypothetical protein
MKKLIISLIASFMLCAFAYSADQGKPQTGGPDPKTNIGQSNKPDPVAEYRNLEKALAGHKAEAAKAGHDLEVKIAELRKNPDKNEVEIGVKKARSEHDAALKGHERETKHIESRLDELKKIPEVAICVFPPRPRPFPPHWGRPPAIQTKDIRELPGGFGMGSSTLAHWIKENIEEDKANGKGPGKEKPDVLTDKEKLDPRKSEGEVLKQVKEGKISQADARKKLDALRGEMEKRGEFKRPKRPQKPELSDDVKDKLQDIKDLQDAIAKEMKTKLDGLKKDGATREEMREAVHAFQKDNKDRLETIRDAHKEIHESLKDARPPKPERPELTTEIKVKVEVLREKQKELHTARKDLHENLKDKSKEDREALIADFKKDNKAKHEDIKAKAKEVKQEIRALIETEATRTSDL